MKICSMPECGKQHYCKGYCKAHYGRIQRHGDPNLLFKRGPKALFSSEGLKICTQCKTPKNPEAFYKNPSTNVVGACKECRSLERRSPKWKNYMLQRLYGLSLEAWREIIEKQHGVCAICKSLPRDKNGFCVDHDHKTKKVRGLLCNSCNRALGLLKDSITALSAAIDYLKRTGSYSGTQ